MRLIGLCGPKGVGKSTVAAVLEAEGWERLSFASPIKAMLSAAFGLDFARLTPEQKETPLAWLGVTPRRLMQTLGEEWGRSTIDRDLWLKLMRRELVERRKDPWVGPVNYVVIDDVRYDNEAALVKEMGGHLLQVTRKGFAKAKDSHASEKGVSPSFIDRGLDMGKLQPNTAAYLGRVKSIAAELVR